MNANFLFSDKPHTTEGATPKFPTFFKDSFSFSKSNTDLIPRRSVADVSVEDLSLKNYVPAGALAAIRHAPAASLQAIRNFSPAKTYRKVEAALPPRAWQFIFAGVAVGAVAAYFLNKEKGAERRTQFKNFLMDQGQQLRTQFETLQSTIQTNAANRQAASAPSTEPISDIIKASDSDDSVLENRIKSQFGRDFQSLNSIKTSVAQGIVTLAGYVPADQVEKVMSAARGIPGVKNVINNFSSSQDSSSTSSMNSMGSSSHLGSSSSTSSSMSSGSSAGSSTSSSMSSGSTGSSSGSSLSSNSSSSKGSSSKKNKQQDNSNRY